MLDGIKLNLDNPPLHDGKGIWINNITTYEIVWYDTHQRWTFYDIINNELYLAPINLSPLSDPIILSQPSQAFKWTYIGSRFRWYELEIQCITTPAPTPVLPPTFNFEPCWFPDDIVHDWHLDHLRTWHQCYYTTYSDGTTKSDLDFCLNQITSQYGATKIDLENIYIFVGAVEKKKLSHAYIGAYGHVEILQTLTTGTTRAQQITYNGKLPKQTWWYYVNGVAFGFTDEQNGRISLRQGGCDVWDLTNKNALCWHLINSQTGGWRAGDKTNLNFERNIYKILYYKQCNVTKDIATPAPTLGVCAIINVESNDYTDLKKLNDYGVINDFKYSWQDIPPNTNKYELGWLDVENTWILDTVAKDNKIWLLVDDPPNYFVDTDGTFPNFDQETIWENQANRAEQIKLTLSCNESETTLFTAAPSPPDQSTCLCIQVDTDGLSAIDGNYKYLNNTISINDGGNYYRPKDNMRLYYDTNVETWFITGSGAYFKLTDLSFIEHQTNPTQIPPLEVDNSGYLQFTDQITGIIVSIKFNCGTSNTECPYPPECIPYNQYDYVDGEYEYIFDRNDLSITQIGFPINPTNNEDYLSSDNTQQFERQYDEFLYSKNFDQSIIKLSISDYIIPNGNITLSRELYPPNKIKLVYDSLDPKVYRDNNIIGLWFQLSDKFDSTYIDLSDVSIEVFAHCPNCIGVQSGIKRECDVQESQINTENYGGFNIIKCEYLIVHEQLFIENTTNTLEIWGELRDLSNNNNKLINTTDKIELTLAPRIEAKGIDFPGIYGEFALSPRYATDEIKLNLWLNSDKLFLKKSDNRNKQAQYRIRYAQAWWLSIEFNNALIKYISFIPDNTTWGTIRSLYTIDESNNNGIIEIWGSKIGQLLNTNGRNVSIGYFLFEVHDDVIDATYDNVLSFKTISISGDNGYSIASNVPGRIADINGWYTEQASLKIIPDDPIDIFIEVDTNNLWNTAFISGDKATISFPIYVVYHFHIIQPKDDLDCYSVFFTHFSYSTNDNKCVASAYPTQTDSGIVYMNITADNIDTIQIINVWLPLLSTFKIIPYNTGSKPPRPQYILAEINMAYRSVGDKYYESLPLYIYCNFTLGNTITTSQVLVNEFVNRDLFEIDNPNILEIIHGDYQTSRYLIRGLQAGPTVITLKFEAQSREFATVAIQIGGLVNIDGFGGILITHTEFKPPSYQIVNINQDEFTTITILSDLKQYLSHFGDRGSIHPFMKLSDGVLIDLTDEQDIIYTSTIPQYLEIETIDKTNKQNMKEPGAYATILPGARQMPWSSLIEFEWLVPSRLNMTFMNNNRIRGKGCIYGTINETNVTDVDVTLSCNTTIITRLYDPANYIFGIPVECELIVTVYWSDNTQTDLSIDNRTNYNIITNNNLLILQNKNIVRANTSCNIYTNFMQQNTKCYGTDTIEVSFTNYPILANWTDRINISVVIFDRLKLVAYPYPNYDISVSNDGLVLNKFYCLSNYEMSILKIFGNLTNGMWKELTPRNDIIVNKTSLSSSNTNIELKNNERLVIGKEIGASDIDATLYGSSISLNRDDYHSNIISYDVTNVVTQITLIKIYTFSDRNNTFNNIINSQELLKIDVFFSDGLIINDILYEIIFNNLFDNISPIDSITSIFNFSSTDPNVLNVDEYGYVEILANWWREVNITVNSKCGNNVISDKGIIYPNLKPSLWDVYIESNSNEVNGLQFANNNYETTFSWNIYINSGAGALLSFSIRIWWNPDLFVEDTTWPQCISAGHMLSWNIDTLRGELLISGIASDSGANNVSLELISTCNFKVNTTDEYISEVIAHIIEITYIDSTENVIKHIYNKPATSSHGYQQINEGTTVIEFPAHIMQRYNETTTSSYECSQAINDELIFQSNQDYGSGCCQSIVFGDVNYDCQHTALDAKMIELYMIDTSSISPYYTLNIDLLLQSQRIAMDLSLNYFQNNADALCSDPIFTNPCPNGLEDLWYSLQVSTGKFLYLNVTTQWYTLQQHGAIVHGFAPMFIQEYPSNYRLATAVDTTVYFELTNVSENINKFFQLSVGEHITQANNDTILIKGEYIENKYWSFATKEYYWIEECFSMSILYETYAESSTLTSIDRQYSFYQNTPFTYLCVQNITFTYGPSESPIKTPTRSPTNHPTTSSPTKNPTTETINPTQVPTENPTTTKPTENPTTAAPTSDTQQPTVNPTTAPTLPEKITSVVITSDSSLFTVIIIFGCIDMVLIFFALLHIIRKTKVRTAKPGNASYIDTIKEFKVIQYIQIVAEVFDITTDYLYAASLIVTQKKDLVIIGWISLVFAVFGLSIFFFKYQTYRKLVALQVKKLKKKLEKCNDEDKQEQIITQIRHRTMDINVISLLNGCIEDVPQTIIVLMVTSANAWNYISILTITLSMVSFTSKLSNIVVTKLGCMDESIPQDNISQTQTQLQLIMAELQIETQTNMDKQ
eukprot:368765_1